MSLVTGGQHCCLHECGGARQLLCGGSCPESLALGFTGCHSAPTSCAPATACCNIALCFLNL